MLETVFDQLADAIVLPDRDKAATGVSQAAEKLFGMMADQMIGRNCKDVFRSRIAGCWQASRQTSLRLELVVAKQAQVGEAIAFGFEDRAAIDAALGDVMGNVFDNAALSPWHNLCVW